MEDLLPYYERELSHLRRYGREFAERYPKIANRLLLSADGSQDPHVERLIESFALLGARISKKIDDDYPEFTEALLEVLYPHYLRPFPSCSIACFDMGPALSKLSAPVQVPRGTVLQSRQVRGVSCRFRTAYDVLLAPLRVSRADYLVVADPPMATSLPAGSGGQISLGFDLLGENASARWPARLRLFVDGEPSFRAALRDALSMQVLQAYLEPAGTGKWLPLPAVPLRQVGFAEDEALIDFPARSHPAYRLLTELFAFPEKFGFFDLDLSMLPRTPGQAFVLHLVLRGSPGETAGARTLEALAPEHLRSGCTPVVNLFPMHGEPIRITHETESYPVVADARRAFAYEVYSIDSVQRVRQTPQGEQIVRFRPFYSLNHGEDPDRNAQYWLSRRDADVARRSPGHETELSFVDLNFDPAAPQTDVVSLELSCTNRDLPAQLAYGVSGGDLSLEGGSPARTISLLRKPTPTLRFARGRGAQWRLISHLSLNTLSLTQSGLPALKEMLRLYDLSQSAVTGRQIEGIVGLAQEPATLWLSGQRFGSVVRGVRIVLDIDESGFVGNGVGVFAAVMDRFFGLYVHANSFTQLVLKSAGSGEVLIECKPRNGESILA
ncbi:type VI secretion system baseplate subunit TssF [Pseudoxanthomonas kalamensis DSM 18571]|uniref:type VI secretion system baseplate subunit TssF n=1 Tax=Pseudoxanthomonas kalamensis TaxID=289483 RepID=UPI001390B30B|nr:type VI secretion system baseplate subunit TssF [Pseudoxanthomonas kalamensis]KAF1712000.1 type VI secretion system baseplate subunit TssF [Pseudoxanthomonas kalamensis DSM 18571]